MTMPTTDDQTSGHASGHPSGRPSGHPTTAVRGSDHDTEAGPPRGGAGSSHTGGGSKPIRVRRPQRRWPWILGLVLTALALVGAVVLVWFTPVLGLRTVDVAGADDPVATSVRAAVAVEPGTPLARIDLDEIAERAASVPEVAAAEVGRSWPDALVVTVTERTPVAVTAANGRWWLVDSAGKVYRAVDAPPAGLLTVELATPGEGDPATVAALQVAAALTPELRAQVATIAARTPFDVRLTLTDRRTVLWGDADRSAVKVQILPALLGQPGSAFDISDPTMVTVR